MTEALDCIELTMSDARADDHRRNVYLAPRRIVIARRAHGVAMRLTLAPALYRGVVLAPPRVAGEVFRITLAHADPDLSIVLHESRDDGDVIALWRRWSMFFGLPQCCERPCGAIAAWDPMVGAVTCARPAPRRRGALITRRRGRFALRRKTGQPK